MKVGGVGMRNSSKKKENSCYFLLYIQRSCTFAAHLPKAICKEVVSLQSIC